MKSCSVTEETYIAKYHTEEQKLSQMREKLENFQKEKIRVQEQLLQIKKKLKSKRMEQGEFALLEKRSTDIRKPKQPRKTKALVQCEKSWNR